MKNIVLFASGSGTNAENIILHFNKSNFAAVVAVFCNNPNAKVLTRAKNNKVPVVLFSKEDLNTQTVLKELRAFHPDLIVLAGFLWQFPTHIIQAYPNKIINIHPALLPKYGGKGMYGMRIHQAILDHNETESGISIHYVNEAYDEGELIFQKKIALVNCQTSEDIAQKIHELEQEFFPIVIEKLLNPKL